MLTFIHSFIHYRSLSTPHRCIYMTHANQALKSHDLLGEGINFGSHNTFLITQGYEGPPQMRDQFNAGATSETTQTWKTIHNIHAPSHSNMVNMKGWLWCLNDIRGSCGSKFSWHLTYRWGKTPKKTNLGNLSRPGIELVSAAWQARTLPPAPEQWTIF